MAILALDLGGTKLATAVFSPGGEVMTSAVTSLDGAKGEAVWELIRKEIVKHLENFPLESIGVSVPGISRQKSGTVWAPNIGGWEDFPLLARIRSLASVPVVIDSDRACSIFGELWQGNAKGCKHAIFIAVGTGIGAGIVDEGKLIRGVSDISGAIGWMALSKAFDNSYVACGDFEFHASGAGIPKFTAEVLSNTSTDSSLRKIEADELTAYDVFAAFEKRDAIASVVIRECVGYWGRAAANLVSIFNPEKIIFGGGLFGPAAQLIGDIKAEASKWAQPISITQVNFERSALGGDAAVYGAAFVALKKVTS